MAIISTQRLKECQDFVDKVSESRFNKVKQRQLNKFNLLINRKEGNITRFNNTNPNNLNSQSNLSSQVSQANPHNPTPAIGLLPPREGDNPLATGHLLPEGTSLPQGNSQVISSQPNSASQVIGNLPTPAIAHLPPGEGSNSPPATVHPSSEGNSSPSIQASGSLPSPAIAHLPPGEGSNSLLATVHPSSEGNSAPTIQAPGSLPSLATAHLLPGEGSSSLPGASHLPLEDVSSSQASSLHIHSEGKQLPSSL